MQRLAERAQKLEACSTRTPLRAAPQRASNNVERAALAAIAAAVAPEAPPAGAAAACLLWRRHGSPDRAEAVAVPGSLMSRAPSAHEPATPETFIPQAAERAPARAPRMPKFEDLPMPAQNEIRQARGEVDEEHPQKTRMSLLQRLANVGLGRRDEETEPPIAARASGPAMPPMPPLPERKPKRSVAQQIAANEPVSEYARRPRTARIGHPWPPGTCCARRHRATIILISRPSCAGRPTEVCYNSDDGKGPG